MLKTIMPNLLILTVAALVCRSQLPTDPPRSHNVAFKDEAGWASTKIASFYLDWADWQVHDFVFFKTAENNQMAMIADPFTGKWSLLEKKTEADLEAARFAHPEEFEEVDNFYPKEAG